MHITAGRDPLYYNDRIGLPYALMYFKSRPSSNPQIKTVNGKNELV
jgi:hypothetical protein